MKRNDADLLSVRSLNKEPPLWGVWRRPQRPNAALSKVEQSIVDILHLQSADELIERISLTDAAEVYGHTGLCKHDSRVRKNLDFVITNFRSCLSEGDR